RVRDYQDKEGSPRSVTEVEASSVGHDLSRGVAHFSRTRRAPGETAAESADAVAAASSPDDEEPAGRDGPGLPDGRGKDETAGTGGAGRSGAGQNGAGKRDAGRSGRSGAGKRDAGENGAGENGAGEDGAGGDGVLDDRAVAEFASEIG